SRRSSALSTRYFERNGCASPSRLPARLSRIMKPSRQAYGRRKTFIRRNSRHSRRPCCAIVVSSHRVAIVIRFVLVSRFRKISFLDSRVSASQISSDEPAPYRYSFLPSPPTENRNVGLDSNVFFLITV